MPITDGVNTKLKSELNVTRDSHLLGLSKVIQDNV